MNKEKVVYRFNRYEGRMLKAKSEIPFHMKLTARLMLDQLCYEWNKKQLQHELDEALVKGDMDSFEKLSLEYRQYVYE